MSFDARSKYASIALDRATSVVFSPVVASEKEYQDLFASKGFGDLFDLAFIEERRSGLVRFASVARADLFIETMNGYHFKGPTMRCQRARTVGMAKTLYLSWSDSGRVSERAIYRELSPLGFIRRITSRGVFAFVEFDTIDDALNAYKRRRECYIEGVPVKISFAKREYKLDTQKISVNVSDLLPDNDPLWLEIQKRVANV